MVIRHMNEWSINSGMWDHDWQKFCQNNCNLFGKRFCRSEKNTNSWITAVVRRNEVSCSCRGQQLEEHFQQDHKSLNRFETKINVILIFCLPKLIPNPNENLHLLSLKNWISWCMWSSDLFLPPPSLLQHFIFFWLFALSFKG